MSSKVNNLNFIIYILLLLLQELLALEEKMGTVSTALTEEALSKCLERSVYFTVPTEPGTMDFAGVDDVKCSICQVHLMQ